MDQPFLGTLVTTDSAEVVEVISSCGFEWLFFDVEHSPLLEPATVQRLLQVVQGTCYSVVRVPENGEAWIKRMLDTGCDGVLVPHVNNGRDAERAVRAAKYPPDGSRSVGIARAHRYGLGFRDYLERANEDIAVIVQVEHVQAVRNIEEILAVSGVSAVFIGPYDLSGSMDRLGYIQEPRVTQAVDFVRQRCGEAGMPVGIFAPEIKSARAELEKGTSFVAVGSDLGYLASSAKAIAAEFLATSLGDGAPIGPASTS